jgi:hypothetical protein
MTIANSGTAMMITIMTTMTMGTLTATRILMGTITTGRHGMMWRSRSGLG